MVLHDRQTILRGGAPLAKARAALVLLHGRGASAEDIFSLGEAARADSPDVALVAPQAAGNSWYPQRFLAPTARNEPYLSSALGVITNLLAEASENRIRYDRVVLAGFSQGACLALEFASRNARRYGGVVGLSGALIGPRGGRAGCRAAWEAHRSTWAATRRTPTSRWNASRRARKSSPRSGPRSRKTIFKGLGHTVNAEELDALRKIVQQVAASS